MLNVSGNISETGGARSLNKSGDGTLILAGTSTYTGGTNLNGGTLDVSGTLTGAVAVASGTTLNSASGVTLSGATTFSGTSSYSGSITAPAGITVASGANVAGVGAISGNVTVNSGGTLAPGDPQITHVGGNVDLNNGRLPALPFNDDRRGDPHLPPRRTPHRFLLYSGFPLNVTQTNLNGAYRNSGGGQRSAVASGYPATAERCPPAAH